MPDDDPETPEGEPSDAEAPAPEMTNAADRGSIRKARTKAQRKEEEARSFWRAAFHSEIGRRELWGILMSCHAFEERFACGPNGFPQSEATWFEAGQQAFGWRLFLSWRRLVPEGVLLMLDENETRLAGERKRSPGRPAPP